jgi:hypothetical protein
MAKVESLLLCTERKVFDGQIVSGHSRSRDTPNEHGELLRLCQVVNGYYCRILKKNKMRIVSTPDIGAINGIVKFSYILWRMLQVIRVEDINSLFTCCNGPDDVASRACDLVLGKTLVKTSVGAISHDPKASSIVADMHLALPAVAGGSYDLVILDPAGSEFGKLPAVKVQIGSSLTMSCYHNLVEYFSAFKWKYALIKFRPAVMLQHTLDELERFSRTHSFEASYHNNVVNTSEIYLLFGYGGKCVNCLTCSLHRTLLEWLDYSSYKCSASRSHLVTFFAKNFGRCKITTPIYLTVDANRTGSLLALDKRTLALDN